MGPEGLRNSFYSALLNRQSTGPERDLPAIARAWLISTNASWVWLWLRNYTGPLVQWELVAAASADEDSPPLPPHRTFQANNCLGDWCLITNEPLLEANVETELNHDGRLYRAELAQWLQERNAYSFDLIPLTSVPSNGASNDPTPALPVEVSGMIALHYKSDEQRVKQPSTALERMAQMTAHAILRSFREKQISLLVTLNALETEYLPRFGKPRIARQDYIAALIAQMTKALNSAATTIFYLGSWSKAAHCIGTTGLYNRRQKCKVTTDLLPSVKYELNSSTWTAECLRTCKTRVRPARHPDTAHHPVFMEMPRDKPLAELALILVPIPGQVVTPTPAGITGSPSLTKACGVIRISGHSSPLSPGEDKNFDALEIQLAEFIAAQIGPVLATFSHAIAREDAITILKHDLLAPLTMFRHCLSNAEKAPYERPMASMPEYQLKHYDLKSMQYAQLFAQNLVLQLDVDPYEIKSLRLEPTVLEGDVIARLKNVMGHFASEQNDMSIRFTGFRSDEGTPTIPALLIDKILTERVFTNLLSNAIKYGQKSTCVTITTHISRNGLHVYVSNEGIGISESEAPYVFEPYFRGVNARTTATGAGLGLGIARTAMRAMGGDILLSSRRDPTVFDVFFPNKLLLVNR